MNARARDGAGRRRGPGPVRLAYISGTFPVSAEVFLAVEINALRARGAHVQVFALRNRGRDHQKQVIEQGVEDLLMHHDALLSPQIVSDAVYWMVRRPVAVVRFFAELFWYCSSRPGVLPRSLGVALKSFRIARLVQRDAIPIVHTAWSHYPSVAGLLIKQLVPGVKLTMALGAHDRSFHHPMTARAAARAECLLTQGRSLREMIIREFPEMNAPIRTIMRGVDTDRTKKHVGRGQTPGLIASVGRLDPDKGHQYLIRALALIKTTMPHARLDIYGTGPYEEELVSLARSLGVSDSVCFIGHVAQDVMFAGLARARVFALATLVDNLPNSVKEAMALGLPVVTTPTNGINELVIDGKMGFIVDADDVTTWAAKLEHLLRDDASTRRMGAAGQAQIRAVASLARTTDARFTLYSLIAQQARKAAPEVERVD